MTDVRHHAARWNTYQRERFPLLGHGLLIAAFSSSAIAFSSLLRGQTHFPNVWLMLAGFFSSLTIFLQLRIADEFKDFEEDCAFRPYRPVPRGIVRLAELRWVAIGCALVQVAIAIAVDARLLLLLGIVWAYLACMTAEFFVPSWLKARPIIYMVSHMAIMPLIDLFVSAFDWLPARAAAPGGLVWFLFVSFSNGIVVEIGRKIRAPKDEERGVETYSALWGRNAATLTWLAAIAVTASFAAAAAGAIGEFVGVVVVLGIAIVVAVVAAGTFLRAPTSAGSKRLELVSGAWTLIMYLGLGTVPMLVRTFR